MTFNDTSVVGRKGVFLVIMYYFSITICVVVSFILSLLHGMVFIIREIVEEIMTWR